MAEEGEQPKNIFEDVIFTIVTGPKLSVEESDELADLLVKRGAEERSIKKGEHGLPMYQLDEVTHMISPDIDFMGYTDVEQQQLEQQHLGQSLSGQVEEKMIAIVTPDWVRTSVAKNKTQHVRAYNPDPRYFFSGIVATAAGLPDGDRDAIFGGLQAMGGQISSGLTKFTTHLIALNIDHARCQHVITRKLSVKIVLPHWFDDCLKLGKRIDEKPYILPNPEVEHDYSNDNPPFPEVKLEYTFETNKKPPKLKKTNQFLVDKKIYFGTDVEIHQMLKDTLKSNIRDAGGEAVDTLLEANITICHWRDGGDYLYSMRKGFEVGNLTWLYWMINKAEWTSPLQRLLHHPKPRNPVPGMEKMKISVSNYGGDARLYIEALIEACGATFTRNMKQDNTHLITARDNSEKCQAARDWNVMMVNHLWLEESYAKYEVQAYTNQRYIFFPPRTNLMEVVGKTRIDSQALEQFYIPPDGTDDAMQDASDGNNVAISSLRIDASMATAEQQPSSVGDNSPTSETPKASKPAGRGRGRPKGSLGSAQTPVRAQAPTADPPSVMSTGRKAKDKAINNLHDTIMPDLLQYEKEKKRKGGVLYGGRRSSSPKADATKPGSAKKRSLEEDDDTTSESDSKAKKQKQKPKKASLTKASLPKASVFLLVTSHDLWNNDKKKDDSDKKALRELGVVCIDQPDENMTHLAAPKILRTRKFICGMAFAPIIVNTQWIQDCIDQKSLLETKPFLLKSDKGSGSVNLVKSLERAKANGRSLLKGLKVYVSQKVNGGFDTYKDIVEANGGGCVNFKAARSGSIARYDVEEHGEENRLVLLSTSEEEKLNKSFKSLAQKQGWEPLVFSTNWLVDAAMQQQLSWSGDEYHVE